MHKIEHVCQFGHTDRDFGCINSKHWHPIGFQKLFSNFTNERVRPDRFRNAFNANCRGDKVLTSPIGAFQSTYLRHQATQNQQVLLPSMAINKFKWLEYNREKGFCTTCKELKKSNQMATIGTTNFRWSMFDCHCNSRENHGAVEMKVLCHSMTQATEKATREKEKAICQPWGQCTS